MKTNFPRSPSVSTVILSCLFYDDFGTSCYIVSNDCVIRGNELERVWKAMVVA